MLLIALFWSLLSTAIRVHNICDYISGHSLFIFRKLVSRPYVGVTGDTLQLVIHSSMKSQRRYNVGWALHKTNVKDCNSECLDQLNDDIAPGENGK